jgi:Prokaryotic Cytochrome C oxidase subunit IV
MVLGFERKLLLVWALLVGVTLLSWQIGANHGHGVFVRTPAITFGVLAIAALKARIIIRRFMEASDAPALLRRLTDGWLLLATGALVVVYALRLGIAI